MHPQVQRICLEAAVPALLAAILECSKHAPDEFITDVDLMTVKKGEGWWGGVR
jgi:hypothetical protein